MHLEELLNGIVVRGKGVKLLGGSVVGVVGDVRKLLPH